MAAVGMLKVDDTQYDLARKRAEQQNSAQVQTQRDAIARRAAQTGGGVSGALIKQDQLTQQAGSERLANANEGIDAQRSQENQRVNEINTGRQYQTSEREAGQKHATSERLGSQTFQAGESQKAIDASFKQQRMQIAAAAREGKLNRAQEAAKLNELKRQYDVDTAENRKTNIISTILSAHNSGLDPTSVGQLLASLGIDVGAIPGLTGAVAPPAYAAPGGYQSAPQGTAEASNPDWSAGSR